DRVFRVPGRIHQDIHLLRKPTRVGFYYCLQKNSRQEVHSIVFYWVALKLRNYNYKLLFHHRELQLRLSTNLRQGFGRQADLHQSTPTPITATAFAH
ncbi:MAG: hypothetical protein V3V10_06470, partial [Planctomycetota bacterium]